jgi:hypothetical protein
MFDFFGFGQPGGADPFNQQNINLRHRQRRTKVNVISGCKQMLDLMMLL